MRTQFPYSCLSTIKKKRKNWNGIKIWKRVHFGRRLSYDIFRNVLAKNILQGTIGLIRLEDIHKTRICIPGNSITHARVEKHTVLNFVWLGIINILQSLTFLHLVGARHCDGFLSQSTEYIWKTCVCVCVFCVPSCLILLTWQRWQRWWKSISSPWKKHTCDIQMPCIRICEMCDSWKFMINNCFHLNFEKHNAQQHNSTTQRNTTERIYNYNLQTINLYSHFALGESVQNSVHFHTRLWMLMLIARVWYVCVCVCADVCRWHGKERLQERLCLTRMQNAATEMKTDKWPILS